MPAPQWGPKATKSALCLIPPRSAWAAIQEVRCFTDKGFCRWPPHCNILYPFLEDDDQGKTFEAAAHAASEALRPFNSFEVDLRCVGFFDHGRSATLWLQPEARQLAAVHAALLAAFPACTELSSDPGRGITAYTPHLSLAQVRGAAGGEAAGAAAAAAAAALGAAWQPLRFTAAGVALISRRGFDDPFTLRHWVPFGGGAPLPVDRPYVATVGEGPPPSVGDPWAAEFGISAAGTAATADSGAGVWNFAYGANMSPAKLEGARGLAPLESRPARLPGWRLAFTHRGGMGNLVAVAAPGGSECGEGTPREVHGVLHRLSAGEYARLACMEHEYRPTEVEVEPYGGGAPIRAVAFLTPEDAAIPDGLPPPARYVELLRQGARHWGLDPGYAAWLEGLPTEAGQRGERYYQRAADGQPLPALPRIRTSSVGGGGGRGGGGGKGQRPRRQQNSKPPTQRR